MEVIATDQGIPPKSDSVMLEIEVRRNEHSPSFERQQYVADVSEKIRFSDVILTVKATDEDAENQPGVSVTFIVLFFYYFNIFNFSCHLLFIVFGTGNG